MEQSSHSTSSYLVANRLTARRIFLACLSCVCLSGCVSTTESGAIGADNRQLMLVPSGYVNNLSAQSYAQVKSDAQNKGELDKNPAEVQRVNTIVKKLIPQTAVFRKDALTWNWETHVITSAELNAYCMPGGKIMVYSGLIEKLNITDAELAAVIGHEIGHALREHGRERMSQDALTVGGTIAAVETGQLDPKYANAAMAALTLAITLPFSRSQETQADEIGLELMARAGYDPNEAVNLWKKMSAAGGPNPPELLSTHPTDNKRIARIQSDIPKVLPLYQAAKH